MQTTAEKKQASRRPLAWLLPGIALGVAAAVGLMYLGALVVTAGVFCGAAAGGLLAARRKGRGGEAGAGLACGLALASLIALATLVAPGSGGPTSQLVRYALSAAAGGFFGGMLCVKRGGARKRKRRRK